jgi:hypothetical protein
MHHAPFSISRQGLDQVCNYHNRLRSISSSTSTLATTKDGDITKNDE